MPYAVRDSISSFRLSACHFSLDMRDTPLGYGPRDKRLVRETTVRGVLTIPFRPWEGKI